MCDHCDCSGVAERAEALKRYAKKFGTEQAEDKRCFDTFAIEKVCVRCHKRKGG